MDTNKIESLTSNPTIINPIVDNSFEKFEDYLKADFDLVLTNDMLKKVDLMSMGNSLEVRTPFLDHHLVEYVFSIANKLQNRQKTQKRKF